MVTPMEDDDGMEQQQESRTFDSYHLVRTIGEGEFGKVKLAIHMQTGKEVRCMGGRARRERTVDSLSLSLMETETQ